MSKKYFILHEYGTQYRKLTRLDIAPNIDLDIMLWIPQLLLIDVRLMMYHLECFCIYILSHVSQISTECDNICIGMSLSRPKKVLANSISGISGYFIIISLSNGWLISYITTVCAVSLAMFLDVGYTICIMINCPSNPAINTNRECLPCRSRRIDGVALS